MNTKTKYLPFVESTLRAAALLANAEFGKVTPQLVKAGDNNQVLTQTDIAVGQLIVGTIMANFPKDNIIDEEAGVINNQSEMTWVVDPIDGTSNFSVGLPTYGIMIGLLCGNTPILGGIMLPYFNQLYLAQKGLGAFCNNSPIHVPNQEKLLSCLVAYGIDGHQEDPEMTLSELEILGRIILGIRNLRTTNSAYDMVQVPAGRYGAYLNRTHKVWDSVALQPLVEEAGGIVTDFWGAPPNYENLLTNPGANYTFCAAAPRLHNQLQRIIQNQS